MNLKSQKRLAASIMKVGVSRVRVKDVKEISDAITRNDIRDLIKKDIITKVQKRGTTRVSAKKRLIQKKKGRRLSEGSRKGKATAKFSKKDRWMKKVRALRNLLRNLRDSGKIKRNDYRKIYLKVKGGAFRSKKHLLYYMKEHEMIKVKKVE